MIDKILFQFFVGLLSGSIRGYSIKVWWFTWFLGLVGLIVIGFIDGSEVLYSEPGWTIFWRIPVFIIGDLGAYYMYKDIFKKKNLDKNG